MRLSLLGIASQSLMDASTEMNNRVAFIDFVQGLLHLDPALRWSPQQARMHPFVLGEPLTQPFSPPPTLKSNGMHPASKSVPPSPQLDQKRPYGGLPPAPQRSATRTYENAAYVEFFFRLDFLNADSRSNDSAYNQHINLQQGYTAQAQQAAQRAAQIPTNPYQDSPSSQNQGSSYGSTSRDTMANQQHQQSSQQAPQFTNSFAYGPRTTHAGMAGNGLANPPPVHHYTSRGRSNTLTQEVPPSLQKFTNHLGVNAETGQSVTPVCVLLSTSRDCVLTCRLMQTAARRSVASLGEDTWCGRARNVEASVGRSSSSAGLSAGAGELVLLSWIDSVC